MSDAGDTSKSYCQSFKKFLDVVSVNLQPGKALAWSISLKYRVFVFGHICDSQMLGLKSQGASAQSRSTAQTKPRLLWVKKNSWLATGYHWGRMHIRKCKTGAALSGWCGFQIPTL